MVLVGIVVGVYALIVSSQAPGGLAAIDLSSVNPDQSKAAVLGLIGYFIIIYGMVGFWFWVFFAGLGWIARQVADPAA